MTNTHGTSDQRSAAIWTLIIKATSSTPSSSAIRITSTQVRSLLTLQHFKQSVKNLVVKNPCKPAIKRVSLLQLKLVEKLNHFFSQLFPKNCAGEQLTPTSVFSNFQCKFVSNFLQEKSNYLVAYYLYSITKMPGQLIGRLLGLPAYRDKTTAFVLTAQQTIYRAIIVLLTVTAILWMAVFLYVAFYYSYMPAISHTRPVHLQFESCGKEQGLCSFPTANVTLTRRQQLLMVGQPYRVLVELEMPESRRNQDVGMFMVCLEMKDAEKIVMEKSCRAAMLHYKSPLLQYIMTTALAPFLMSGSVEEKQIVAVELFSGFEEDPSRPVTEAMVQVQSQHVDVYKVALRIHAHFTGLRYFMFHWPVLSAFLGIMTNLFFLSVIAFLSWYKFFTPKQVVVHLGYDSSAAKTLEERRAMAKERLMRERSKLVHQKSTEKKEEQRPEIVEETVAANSGSEKKENSGKDELEKPLAEKESEEKVGKEEKAFEEKRRSSDEYEVISPEAAKEKLKLENEDEADGEEDDEDFSELDPDTNGSNNGNGNDKETCKEEQEEDKENFPDPSKKTKPEAELRQRKSKSKDTTTTTTRSRTTTEEEDDDKSSNC